MAKDKRSYRLAEQNIRQCRARASETKDQLEERLSRLRTAYAQRSSQAE